MKVMFKNRFLVAAPLVLIALTLASFFSLTTRSVSADDVVDDVSIRINVSCTMSGSGMNTHNAIVNPGTFETNIGETTFRVFCNDNEGFAVYAIGYTDDDEGKNVLTSSDVGSSFDIATGTGTSGNSQWAMKLATDSNVTYPVTLHNSFDDWHTVPDDYTLVAKRTAHTDVGMNAVGASFTSTYQVFISSSQPAGNYNGRVKYVMVHPNNGDNPVKSNQIGVVFEGNGLTFSGDASENKIVYGGEDCTDIYIGEPTIVKNSNIANDGTLISPYEYEPLLETVSFDGADGVRVVINYGLRFNNMILVVGDDWDGGEPPADAQYVGGYSCDSDYFERCDGIKTFSFDSDTVTLKIYGSDGGDYGMYAKVYPVYESEQVGTTKKLTCDISSTPVSGTYAETTTWNGKWYAEMKNNDYVSIFEDENAILDYLEQNQTFLYGTTVHFYAFHPYTINYNGNSATAGTMNGYHDTLKHIPDYTTLAAPNYYRSNYGFAGWSEDQNATVGSSKIYGPNEYATGADLHFSNSTHEATLYAVWVPSAGNLQGWTGCSSLGQGQVTALTDTRDNNTYAIAKLADGNCWMIENLRLDTANSSDSSKAQGFGGVFSGLANSESTNFSNTTTANSKYSTSNITGSNQANRIPRYNNSNTSSSVTNMTTTDANIYGYGNYYSWAAAMANTTDLTSANASDSANTSICPSGWRLPYGGETGNGAQKGGFYYLAYKLNNSDWNINSYDLSLILSNFPNNFVLSGHIVNGSYIGWRAYQGLYWSSTASDSSSAYSMNTFNAFLTSSSNKYNGSSIRCLQISN